MRKSDVWMSDDEYRLVTSKTPIPTVDLVVLKKGSLGWETLLLIRKTGYAKGEWCIIGGRIHKGERIRDTIKRQAKDLGVRAKIIHPFDERFPAMVNDQPKQDLTKQSICSVYPVKIIGGKMRKEGEEYKGFRWFPVNKLPALAYDHKNEILKVIGRLKELGVKI
mgnify:CR=1 FL=1